MIVLTEKGVKGKKDKKLLVLIKKYHTFVKTKLIIMPLRIKKILVNMLILLAVLASGFLMLVLKGKINFSEKQYTDSHNTVVQTVDKKVSL